MKLPPPTNFLLCREAHQIAKYRLRNAERELKVALNVVHDHELERKLLLPSCLYGQFAPLASQYKVASMQYDRAVEVYEMACNLQRQLLKKTDDNIPAPEKSK
jgi:hypothetical protein